MGGLAADVMQFGTPQTGFLGAHRRRRARRCDRALDRRLEGAGLGPRPDAGAGDPAAHHASSPASLMIVVLRQADRLADDRAQRRPEQHERRERGPARRDPRPDDGLRHGWPAEQGRLQLRRRRRRRSPPPASERPAAARSWPRSCSPAWCRRSRWPWRPWSGRSCSPPPSARTARPPGCSARRSSPRARSRSRRPTRCG